MKYNVIGDIHGRTSWKELVIDDGINIFVGDYFSPYHREYTFEKCMQNFRDIIEFKKQRPETILLIGNHDADHWQWNNDRYQCSRHDFEHDDEICELFEQNKDLFQVAYSVNNQYLITHAGVSALWLYRVFHFMDGNMKIPRRGDYLDLSYLEANDFDTVEQAYDDYIEYMKTTYPNMEISKIDIVKEDFNLLYWKGNWYESLQNKWHIVKWFKDVEYVEKLVNEVWRWSDYEFTFGRNASHGDYCGNSITQSPVWIRPVELNEANIFRGTNFKQVVGHTMFRNVTEEDNIVFVDCLEYNPESFTFEC